MGGVCVIRASGIVVDDGEEGRVHIGPSLGPVSLGDLREDLNHLLPQETSGGEPGNERVGRAYGVRYVCCTDYIRNCVGSSMHSVLAESGTRGRNTEQRDTNAAQRQNECTFHRCVLIDICARKVSLYHSSSDRLDTLATPLPPRISFLRDYILYDITLGLFVLLYTCCSAKASLRRVA